MDDEFDEEWLACISDAAAAYAKREGASLCKDVNGLLQTFQEPGQLEYCGEIIRLALDVREEKENAL